MYRLIFSLTLLLLFPFGALPADTSLPPEYDLSVSFNIPASRLMGLASVKTEAGRNVEFNVSNLIIKKVTMNGSEVEHGIEGGRLTVKTAAHGMLLIQYEAAFKENPAAGTLGVVENSIDQRGISLAGGWYPKLAGLLRYRLRAILPKGYEALSEADQIEKAAKGENVEFSFRFDHPVDRITLVAANRYEIFRDSANGIDLYAYFLPEDRGLSKIWLQQAKRYLERYEKILGKYPYKRFSIVENFLLSGYSVPTFMLLGRDAVRLPVIPGASLGHEILHQWFGDSVYVDADKGNWAEGLTTYLADHLYEEEAGRGWEYRKQLLLDYDAYVNSQNEISLREFKGRMDPASKAVGCGKGAMIFHMLKRSLGEEAFYDGLRLFINGKQYQMASWDDIRAAFEKKSGKDLAAFFKQWVDEKGLPKLNAGNSSVVRKGDSFDIGFGVQQEGKAYSLDLPAAFSFMQEGGKNETLKVDTEKKSFTLSVDREPHRLMIDPDYDIARRLTDSESPPVIAALLGDPKPLVVLPVSNQDSYAPVIADLKEQGAEVKEPAGLKDAVIKSSTVVILGEDNPVIGRLFGKVESMKAGFSAMIKKNPWNTGKVIVLINARSSREAEAAFPKISHYGRFSSVAFNAGRNVSKKIDDSQRGMNMELREPATAIDLSTLKTLTEAIRGAAEKKIVYVGEYHDKYAHHLVELDVIKALYEKDPKLGIGMEMFQRPFQNALDDYVAGVIDERAFLKKTEYFKRWVFDYNLYKPILDFARSRKIPVVALNQKKEITDKVAKDGMDSLTDEERKEMPPQMDFSDNEYRDRLKAVFEQHKASGERNFEFFYQAQILWDETMAMSADEFMQKNQDYRMVVVAGGGHLAYGSGIPKRCHRRNGLPFFIVLNDSEADKDIANYLVLPQPLDGTAAPKLMAMLKAENNSVKVIDLPDDSVSRKAGIRAGDTILSIDNEKVESIEDIKLLLFYKKQGQTVKVKALRKRFLVGDKQMEFDVKL